MRRIFQTNNMPQYLLHRYHRRTEARTNLVMNIIKNRDIKWLINNNLMMVCNQIQPMNPKFPIGIMRRHTNDGFALRKMTFYLFGVYQFDALYHLIGRNIAHFYSFNDHIWKIAIKLFGDGLNFRIGLFGK